jgi:hypothetical protein
MTALIAIGAAAIAAMAIAEYPGLKREIKIWRM